MIEDLKVVALDVGGKPESIKTKDWLVQNETYTVEKVIKAKIQGKLGFVLKEIKTNDPMFFGYDVARFGISLHELEKLMESGKIKVEVKLEEV